MFYWVYYIQYISSKNIRFVYVTPILPIRQVLFLFSSKLYLKIPYSYLTHGADYEEKVNVWIEATIVQRNADKTFLIARYLKDFLPKNHPWELMGNAINPMLFHKVNTIEERVQVLRDLKIVTLVDPEDFIILYIGFMVLPIKFWGMMDFIIAFENFLEQIPPENQSNVKLVFVGDGKFRPFLQKKVQQKNLEKNVIFLGRRTEIPELCSIANIGGLTSYQEGMPTVLIEMVAAGVPCMGT